MRKIPAFLLMVVSLAVRGQQKDSLAAVTITGRKPLIERRLDKTVINIGQRLSASGETVLEALRGLPGVQVSAEGAISLAGRAGVQVYLDGKPTYLSTEDLAALLNGMSSATVLRIEIMTNPPARYGVTGTAGIINIVRKKNSAAGFNGNVNGALVDGYFPRYNGGVNGSYKNERVNLSFGDTYNYSRTIFGRGLTSDILSNEQVSDSRNVSWRRTDRTSAGIDWYLSSKTTMSLSGEAGFGVSKGELRSVLDRKGGIVNHEDFVSRDRDRPYNYMSTLQWSQQLDGKGSSLTVDLDHSAFVNGLVQVNQGMVYDGAGHLIGDDNSVDSLWRHLQIYSAQADYVRPVGGGRLEAGWKSSKVAVDVQDTATIERVDALYGQLSRSVGRLELQGGLRAERWKMGRRYFQLFPTLFAGYRVDSSNTVLLRFGRRTEKPDYSEMIPLRRPLTATLYFQGNPYLRPQLDWHGELGWSWKNQLSVTVGADDDHDYMRTLPFPDSGGATITRRPVNLDARSWNVDIAYSGRVTKWWMVDNTISVYSTIFSEGGMVSADWTMSNSLRLDDRWSAEAGGEYESKRKFVGSEFGAYWLVNLAVRRSVFDGRGSVTLAAHNIFQSEGFYSTDRYAGLYQLTEARYYTRFVSVGVSYRWGRGKLTRSAARSSSEEERGRAGN
ncbi:MAG: outer membrane beta-barrel protein [Bacteroidetes bacterium]|nr:outer membrane beta-barrel protein [Bacteroidota bacterium]